MACDRSTARVITLVVLLLIAAIALRGTPPGARHHRDGEPAVSGTAALILIVALLGVSLTLITGAVVVRVRNPRASAPRSVRLDWSRDGARWSRRRLVLLVAGLAVGAALFAVLLSRLGGWAIQWPAAPPAPVSADTAPDPPRPPTPFGHEASDTMLRVLYAAAGGFLVLVAVGSIAATRRPRRSPAPATSGGTGGQSPGSDPVAESLVRAAEVALAEVGDPSREPRAAIIACYAAMERELASVPGAAPRDFDTASEVLARAVQHDALRSSSATPLVELFEEARFSPHVMDEGHRDSAVRALDLVLVELGEDR
jgi:hypothetical protein